MHRNVEVFFAFTNVCGSGRGQWLIFLCVFENMNSITEEREDGTVSGVS